MKRLTATMLVCAVAMPAVAADSDDLVAIPIHNWSSLASDWGIDGPKFPTVGYPPICDPRIDELVGCPDPSIILPDDLEDLIRDLQGGDVPWPFDFSIVEDYDLPPMVGGGFLGPLGPDWVCNPVGVDAAYCVRVKVPCLQIGDPTCSPWKRPSLPGFEDWWAPAWKSDLYGLKDEDMWSHNPNVMPQAG